MVHPPFCTPEILILWVPECMHTSLSSADWPHSVAINTRICKYLHVCRMRSEMVITNTKYPVLGNRFGKVIDGYIFHSLMHDSLAVLHWQVHVAILSDLCFVLIVFKTWKYFQTVLTKFLKCELQCTFNKVWTKARLPVMLTKSSEKYWSSPWICLFGVLVVYILSFLGMGFSTKWSSGDNLLSMKKPQTTPGEASFLWYSLGITSLYKPENLLQPAIPAVAVLASRKIQVHLFVVKA